MHFCQASENVLFQKAIKFISVRSLKNDCQRKNNVISYTYVNFSILGAEAKRYTLVCLRMIWCRYFKYAPEQRYRKL